MSKDVISPEEGAELRELRETYVRATQQAADAIMEDGMSSDAFAKADAEVGKAVLRIRELLGLGQTWMS